MTSTSVIWIDFSMDVRNSRYFLLRFGFGLVVEKARIQFSLKKCGSVCISQLFTSYVLTKQPKLTAIIQSRRLTLFGHIMRMDNNADAKRILLASAPADWRRQLGRPRITWLSTIQQDLKHHHLTLPEAAVWLRTALCGG